MPAGPSSPATRDSVKCLVQDHGDAEAQFQKTVRALSGPKRPPGHETLNEIEGGNITMVHNSLELQPVARPNTRRILSKHPLATWLARILLMAAALGGDTRPASAVDTAVVSDRVLEWGRHAWYSFQIWVREGYDREPAIMIGLAAIVVLPLIAFVGLLLRRQPPESRPGIDEAAGKQVWPHDAWIEVEGRAGSRRPIGRGMLRIGRQDDNELCVDHEKVHRYHAVIHRTPEAEFIITDLSGPDGHGVLVNGQRVVQASLNNGDRIEVGAARITFESSPA
jgi:FHA domain